MKTPIKKLIKPIYFYLVSFVTLMMIIVSVTGLFNLVLKSFIFTKADNYSYRVSKPMGCDSTTLRTEKDIKQLSSEECTKLEEKNKKELKEELQSRKQTDYARNISFLLVAIPLFAIHWYYARKKDEE